MPELPEVETIKEQLSEKIGSKKIIGIRIIDYSKRIFGNTTNLSARIKKISRRAKLLIFELTNGYSFLVHLKLTGQLIYYSSRKKSVPVKSTHVIFTFKDDSQLFFNDARKFGFVKIMKTKEIEKYLDHFGPEPLEIKLSQFNKILAKKERSRLKPALLDPKMIAGIGNIYAQEICFRAGILPDRLIGSLNDYEIKKLYSAMRNILKSAIKHQGTSFDTYYKTAEGERGGYKQYLKVYHQKKCFKCREDLKVIKQINRSTYYCQRCQK